MSWGRRQQRTRSIHESIVLSAHSRRTKVVQVLDEVGSGSYGTVHTVRLVPPNKGKPTNHNQNQNDDNDDDSTVYIGKRAWTLQELHDLLPQHEEDTEYLKEKSRRCQSYLEIEAHCFQKLQQQPQKEEEPRINVPYFRGTFRDEESREWMVFDLIAQTTPDSFSPQPALSLADAMEMDRLANQERPSQRIHSLSHVAQALGLNHSSLVLDDDNDEKDEDDADSVATAASLVAETVVDVLLPQLLQLLSRLHAHKIVHRDIKPANLLLSPTDGHVYLIDFGSAADLDTAGGLLRKNIGLSERVAISPIYAAPEIFINAQYKNSALTFDCFSVALLVCQLLFQYLDERTDAGFHQQFQAAGWKLNTWLATELGGTVRPGGLDVALQVLAQRPGLWTLLQDLLQPDPWDRVTAATALQRLEKLHWNPQRQSEPPDATLDDAVDYYQPVAERDGEFLARVLESMDYCPIPDTTPLEEAITTTTTTTTLPLVRPLQFVATFERDQSLGLLLAEVDSVNPDTDFETDHDRRAWQLATAQAVPGQVYVTGVVPGGQAQALGIMEIGDRLDGVGELPVAEQGFEHVVQMIVQANTVVSPDPKHITLHFVRQRLSPNAAAAAAMVPSEASSSSFAAAATSFPIETTDNAPVYESDTAVATLSSVLTDNNHQHTFVSDSLVQVVDQAAWSSRGRRQSQEDRYILHEVVLDQSTVLLAGVLDGHLGTAAAQTVQEQLPMMLTQELLQPSSSSWSSSLSSNRDWGNTQQSSSSPTIETVLESAWHKVCDFYRSECGLDNGECRVADYDAAEGILDANTGSSQVVAGTTANLVALDKATGRLALLNCGDSRSVVLNQKGDIVFESVDHKPSRELERFKQHMKDNEDSLYSMPRCYSSRWFVVVGDYEYNLSRSLEGPFATARGIISEPTVHMIAAEPDMTIVIATDGLWEVMDTAQVSRIVRTMRKTDKKSAGDIAKTLCSMAIEQGSFDNVSAVIIFLD